MTPLQIPSATLSNGVTMPRLVFGTYQIKDPKICQKAVEDALEAGYRAIDTAQSYGNEAAVGAALKACGLPRSELFITTKLWVEDASEAGARRAALRSMELLGLDYLDLYLIHQPFRCMANDGSALPRWSAACRGRKQFLAGPFDGHSALEHYSPAGQSN